MAVQADGGDAAVVLAGGRSRRMGAVKAELAWRDATLLGHTAALLARTVPGPVLVITAPGQALPTLPTAVEVHPDPEPDLGPLGGLATGLSALTGRARRAFVAAVDLPLLHPALVRAVLAALTPSESVALPDLHGHRQPLAAGYRVEVGGVAVALLADGERRLGRLFERCRPRLLSADELLADPAVAAHDPQLESVRNVNTPAEYAAVLARPDPVVVVHTAAGPVSAPAATVAGLARHLGVHPDRLRWPGGGHPAPHVPVFVGDELVLGR